VTTKRTEQLFMTHPEATSWDECDDTRCTSCGRKMRQWKKPDGTELWLCSWTGDTPRPSLVDGYRGRMPTDGIMGGWFKGGTTFAGRMPPGVRNSPDEDDWCQECEDYWWEFCEEMYAA